MRDALRSLNAKIDAKMMEIALIMTVASIVDVLQSLNAKIVVNRMKTALITTAVWIINVNQSTNVGIAAVMTLIVPRLTVVNMMADVGLRMNVTARKIACQSKIALKMNVVQFTVIVVQIRNSVTMYILAFQITTALQWMNAAQNLVIVG